MPITLNGSTLRAPNELDVIEVPRRGARRAPALQFIFDVRREAGTKAFERRGNPAVELAREFLGRCRVGAGEGGVKLLQRPVKRRAVERGGGAFIFHGGANIAIKPTAFAFVVHVQG